MNERIRIIEGDCLDRMSEIDANSVDTIITDPPYGLSFMGNEWDHGVPGVPFWQAALRVAKPGAMLLAFGGTRTFHRLTCAIEDAGWEIRDCMMWLYGSGFPKSLDISKVIDKNAGWIGESVIALKKELIRLFDASGKTRNRIDEECGFRACNYLSLPHPDKKFDPWTNVLPSQEKWQKIKSVIGSNVDVSRKLDSLFAEAEREIVAKGFRNRGPSNAPVAGFCEGEYDITIPATDLAKEWNGWGTALKPAWEPIIVAMKPCDGTFAENAQKHGVAGFNIDGGRIPLNGDYKCGANGKPSQTGLGDNYDPGKANQHVDVGRWPANVILDEEAGAMLDEQSGERKSGGTVRGTEPSETGQNGIYGRFARVANNPFEDSGGASRFFYCAKASKSDRGDENTHPTVKPTSLMEYLCRLTSTPIGGTVLDPFMGSGTTGVACWNTNRKFIGIEKDPDIFQIAKDRLERACAQLNMFVEESA